METPYGGYGKREDASCPGQMDVPAFPADPPFRFQGIEGPVQAGTADVEALSKLHHAHGDIHPAVRLPVFEKIVIEAVPGRATRKTSDFVVQKADAAGQKANVIFRDQGITRDAYDYWFQ